MAISGTSSSGLTKQRPTSINTSGTNSRRSGGRVPGTVVNGVGGVRGMSGSPAYRQMAATLVDNLLAKAIVKASQELAFTTHTREMSHSEANSRRNSAMKATPTASMILSGIMDINGLPNENPPEIQIDLVGPRTPSPVEESSIEIPAPSSRKYKFKVYDAESMCCNADELSGEDSSCAEPDWEGSSVSAVQPRSLNGNTAYYSSKYTCAGDVIDVATTPTLDTKDLKQAHEISKHIVSDIIEQAVDILKKENHNFGNQPSAAGNLKREPESYSKISCHSSRTTASSGNCSWINRARTAFSSIIRNACLCAKTKDTQFHV